MKTFTKYFLITATLLTIVAGCKKDKQSDPASSDSDEYIEFKIDGQFYRMDEQMNGSNFVVGAATHDGPFSGKYGLQIAFANSTQDEGATVMVLDSEPITKQHYSLDLLNFTSLVTYIKPDQTQFIISATSVGNINFTSIDTTVNHAIEGTFEINNLDLQDIDGNFISTGHTLTDGKFKTSIAP
jgi:hypothetical protein